MLYLDDVSSNTIHGKGHGGRSKYVVNFGTDSHDITSFADIIQCIEKIIRTNSIL